MRTAVKPRDTGNVVNLMDALRESLNDVGKGGASQPAKGRTKKAGPAWKRLRAPPTPEPGFMGGFDGCFENLEHCAVILRRILVGADSEAFCLCRFRRNASEGQPFSHGAIRRKTS